MHQRRPASVTFPLPGSPVFFGAGITTNRPQSSLSGRRSRSGVSTPLLSNEQQYHSYDNDNDDDIESRQGKDDDKPTKMIRNKKDLLILIALCLSYYNAFCAFSMIAPILPNEAKKFGMSQSLYGFVFAIYPLVVFLCSPLVGKWMPIVGVKFSLIAGGFISGGCNILFGCLGHLYQTEGTGENKKVTPSSYYQFVTFCFVLRSVMAVGTAFNETAAVSIMTISFKHSLSSAQGSIALFTGLGLMSGPAIGSALYQFGGNSFMLPFAVIGVFVWLVILMIAFILPPERTFHDNPEDSDETSETKTFWQVFLVPGIFMMSTVTLVAGMVISFLDPTLTPFIKTLDPRMKPFFVGLVFLCAPMTYAISTPFLGRLLDKKIIRGRHASIIGCFLGFICYIFMGPSIILSFIGNGHVWITVTSLLCLGFLCLTAMFVPVLAEMQIVAKEAGLPMNLATDTILSGIYTAMFYIGSIAGPALGGVLTEHFNFEISSTIFAFLLLFEGISLLLFTIWESRRNNRNLGVKVDVDDNGGHYNRYDD